VRSGKISKHKENEYKSSLGGLRQKPISVLNSARIGEEAKPKKFPKNFLKKLLRSGKSSKMIKMSISRFWVVVDKGLLPHNDSNNNNYRNSNDNNDKK
jgi:hypothetical protein